MLEDEDSEVELRIVASFHDRYHADRQAGLLLGLGYYQDLYPKFRKIVAREFGILTNSAGTVSDGAAWHEFKKIGHYRLIEILGRGGQAVVWLAEDERISRRVAVKVLRGLDQSDSRFLARFEREAALTSKIDHPSICPLIDFGFEDVPWIAMRLVPGQTLSHLLLRAGDAAEASSGSPSSEATTGNRRRSGRTPRLESEIESATNPELDLKDPMAVVVLLEKISRAIHRAHEVGVIHRDLKPHNIMITPENEPVILDFGIAASTEGDLPTLTQSGEFVGTPSYMAPEQISLQGSAIDARADIYALGVILFECLTGRRPFERATRESVLLAVLGEEAPKLGEVNRSFHGSDIEVVVESALQKRPEHRYESAALFADELRRVAEHKPILARPVNGLTRTRRWAQRNPALAGSLLIIALLMFVGTGVSLYFLSKTRQALDDVRHERASVFRLRVSRELESLVLEAKSRFPVAVPPTADAARALLTEMDDWLFRAKSLVRTLDEPDEETGALGHRAQLQQLLLRARRSTPEEEEARRRSDFRFPEIQAMRAKLNSLEVARDVRNGRGKVAEFDLDDEALSLSALELFRRAWPLVNSDREIFGREFEGLAMARRMFEVASDGGQTHQKAYANRMLAHALLACGLDLDEARSLMQDSIQISKGKSRLDHEDWARRFEAAIRANTAEVSDLKIVGLREQIAEVEKDIAHSAEPEFNDDLDAWWYKELSRLVDRIESFAGPGGLLLGTSNDFGWGVEKRRDFLAGLFKISLEDCAEDWRAASKRVTDSAVYAGTYLRPQFGLVPLGPDPSSHLEEFWDPASGSRPKRDAQTGVLDVSENTGLVFVLLPEGSYWYGAQRESANKPNYDPEVPLERSKIRKMRIRASFISKYEVTQGQWRRLTGQNPSGYPSGFNPLGTSIRHDDRHPVEMVSWRDCETLVLRQGWTLPLRGFWEYACRAGTESPWWTGTRPESLAGAANLADEAAIRWNARWCDPEDWPGSMYNDGYPAHSPVGTFKPNPFGLYDMIGNVLEWCQEQIGRDRSGLLVVDGSAVGDSRVIARGGSFGSSARNSKADIDGVFDTDSGFEFVGLRPARELVTHE